MNASISLRIVALTLTLAFCTPLRSDPVSYAADLETSRQNPVTDILILEEDSGGTVHGTVYPHDLPGSGHSIILHDPVFTPVRTLVIGLTNGEDAEGNDKVQLVMFVENAFAIANQEVKFSEAFPGARHNVTITNLLAAVAGDTAQVAWFTDFFFTGPAAEAVFNTGESFSVAEFTALTTIGNSDTDGDWVLNKEIVVLPPENPDAHKNLLTVVVDETATSTNVFDIELELDNNGFFAVDKTVSNKSGVVWTSFTLQLGSGVGDSFVPYPTNRVWFNEQSLTRDQSGNFLDMDFSPGLIRFNGYLAVNYLVANFVFFINSSEAGTHTVTIRQTAIDQVFSAGFEDQSCQQRDNCKVFVTSGTYTGDLVSSADSLIPGGFSGSGLEAGDAICNKLATDAGLEGTFTAWLSTSTTNARDRVSRYAGPYVLTDGTTQIADHFTDLTFCGEGTGSDCLDSLLNLDENALAPEGLGSWTGTNSGGYTTGLGNCDGWTTTDGQATPHGDFTYKDYRWSRGLGGTELCIATHHLYCFED